MAAKVEIYLDVQCWLNPYCIFQLIAASPETIIISKIDNWSWENELRLGATADIQRVVDNGRIVLIDSFDKNYGNIGLSIERSGQSYLYSLWFDTYLMEFLDSSVITRENVGFYRKIYSRFSDLVCGTNLDFRYLAIGSEAVLKSDADINEMIFSSSGIAAWIINKSHFLISEHIPYSCKYIDAINAYLLENRKDF